MKHGQTTQLHYRDNELASSSTTLLVHGWGVSGGVWDETISRWPATAGRLIVPELAGSGWSRQAKSGYTIADHAARLLELIEELSLQEVHVVGNSMGATIALWMALENPDPLSKIILVNPVPPSGLPLPPDYVQLFRSACTDREHRLRLMTSAMARLPSPEVLDRLMVDAATVRQEAALESFESFRSASFSDRLKGLKTPITLLSGDSDPFLTMSFLSQTILSVLPETNTQWVAGAGHYPQIESPQEFVAHLVQALR